GGTTTRLAGLPWLGESVSLSFAKKRWCVGKQVSACIHFCVFGSYTETWRGDSLSGITLAEGWSDPFLQKSGLAAGRKRAVTHKRPSESICALRVSEEPSQIASTPPDAAACI